MAVVIALALPVLLLFVCGSIDYGQATFQRQRLQEAIDSATLAATRELSMADARRENVAAVVEAMVLDMMSGNDLGQKQAAINVAFSFDPLEVTVTARQDTRPFFGDAFGLAASRVEVAAVARIIGRPHICVLALDPSANGAISLEHNARVVGNNCAVFSNSTHNNGLRSKNSASLKAQSICTAGGKDGGPGNFVPDPLVDCPTFDDPLASRPEPMASACSTPVQSPVVSSRTLSPGTFCGGLVIKAGAQVTLEPGIYIVKDGPLVVEDGASLTGDGVGFFLTGTGSVLTFNRGSSIDLQAASKGMMAGLLVFEGRRQATSAKHKILSDDARNLLGTIYLSRGQLHVDANSPIADKSAYTAIVARMLKLYGGPQLVLNTNYDLTDVPVPDGIKGVDQPVSLVK